MKALTPSQVQILRLVDAGLTNRQIGARLYVTPDTVKTHLRRINDRLGTSNRADAVAAARQAGALEDR